METNAPSWFMIIMHLELTWRVCLAILLGSYWLIWYSNNYFEEGPGALGGLGALFAMWAMILKIFVNELTVSLYFSKSQHVLGVAAFILVLMIVVASSSQQPYKH